MPKRKDYNNILRKYVIHPVLDSLICFRFFVLNTLQLIFQIRTCFNFKAQQVLIYNGGLNAKTFSLYIFNYKLLIAGCLLQLFVRQTLTSCIIHR